MNNTELEIYVDGVWGAMYSQAGAYKFNFYTISPTPDEGTERREVAVRLAMHTQTVVALRDYLNIQIAKLQELGYLVIEQITPDAKEKPKAPKKSPKKSPMKRTRKPATKKTRKK